MQIIERTRFFKLLAICLGLVGVAHAAGAPLVDLRKMDGSILVRLSYSQSKNAFGKRLYDGNVALLRLPVAQRLARVQRRLASKGLGLLVWDAYRPRSIQKEMWDAVPRARSRYLVHPSKISKHSRGAAVDVTLVNRQGTPLEMPTPHDEFSPRAHREATRGVSAVARRNRATLIAAMRAEGFLANPYEWWHFTAPDWRRYPPADIPVPTGKLDARK